MVTMLVYDEEEGNLELFKKMAKDIFAHLSEDKLELCCFSEMAMVEEFLESAPLMDLACIRITGKGETGLLRHMRRLYARSDFLLVADRAVSPMEYLTPDIRAASLLLHPSEAAQQKQVIKAFLRDYLEKRKDTDGQDYFVVENRSGQITIPFQQIYYIEVRERKVYIRLKHKEYSKYDSLEHILETLPDTFLRCHRSFVFNTQHLDTVKLSENMIYLEYGISVPLSRSYKPAVKEYVNGLRKQS